MLTRTTSGLQLLVAWFRPAYSPRDQCVGEEHHLAASQTVGGHRKKEEERNASSRGDPVRYWLVEVGQTSCTAVDARLSPPTCLLYTSPSPRDWLESRMPSSA